MNVVFNAVIENVKCANTFQKAIYTGCKKCAGCTYCNNPLFTLIHNNY